MRAKRTKKFQIRFSPEEFQIVESLSRAEGFSSISDFLRVRALEKGIEEKFVQINGLLQKLVLLEKKEK